MMRLLLPLLAVLALPAMTALAQNREAQDPVAYLKQGIDLHSAGQYDEAIAYLARYRQIAPSDWRGHVWQALTLLKQAAAEQDSVRRAALLDEARAMQTPLIRQAGMPFRSPLRHYLNGLAANVANDQTGSYRHLKKAIESSPELFDPYASIRLRYYVGQAFALSSMEIATAHIMQGAYEEANQSMEDAKRYLPEDDPRQKMVEANLAVVKEGMGRYDVAIEHLRKCVAYARSDDDTARAEEYIATIALIHLHTKDVEGARKVLAELPKDCKHPDAIAASCRIRMIETERDPEQLLPTLAYFREVMKEFPEDQLQRLVVDYANLCVTYISRADAAEHTALLEQAVELVDATRLRHPECPPPYWLLSKLHALLGHEKEAEQFRILHDRKKEEYRNKHQYDKRGHTRCATTT